MHEQSVNQAGLQARKRENKINVTTTHSNMQKQVYPQTGQLSHPQIPQQAAGIQTGKNHS